MKSLTILTFFGFLGNIGLEQNEVFPMAFPRYGRRIQFGHVGGQIPIPSPSTANTQNLFDWLQKVHQGEDGALTEFLKLCEYRFVRLGHGFSQLMKGKENTPDLVQESLLILFNNILKQQFSSERHLGSYLAHVLNNARMNRYKRFYLTVKRKIGLEVSGIDQLQDKCHKDPSSVFEKSEDLERMARALQILNDKEMAILRMRHQDGMTWTEIGQIAGMSEDCVRKAHGRILGLLRSAMGLKVHVDWVE